MDTDGLLRHCSAYFSKKTREYYKLEEFWGDSISTEINENN